MGVAAEALGVQRCWAFPTQAPQGPADRPGGAAGLTVLTSGLIPARVWGGSEALSELLGAWPVDDRRARGRCVPCPCLWEALGVRTPESMSQAATSPAARAACSGFLSATCHWLHTGAGSGQGRQGCPGAPQGQHAPGAQAQQSEGNCGARRSRCGGRREPTLLGHRDRRSTACVHASPGDGADASPLHSLEAQGWAGLSE